MKVLEKNKAIELRKEGETFSEILKVVTVSKGSLSCWLRGIKLTDEQLTRIKYKNDRIREKFIKFNELRKKTAADNKRIISNKAAGEIDGISGRELKLIGIALYWAEGYKGNACSGIEFINSDPKMVKLMMRWFREICGVSEERFRVRIQIHNKADIEKAEEFWSKITGVAQGQFTKTYTKISPTSKGKSGNLLRYGICSIRISDINLITRVKGWISGLAALSSSPV